MSKTIDINIQNDLDRLRDRMKELREEYAHIGLPDTAPNRDSSALDFNRQLIDLVIDILHSDQDVVLEQMGQIAKVIGETVQGDTYPLNIAIKETNEIRQRIWEKNEEVMAELGVQKETVFHFTKVYNLLIDQFLYSFSMAYIETYEKNMQKSEKEFLLLSAPVVPILDGVAVLPVVGSINEQRAELLMQKALEDAAENELDRMFIDLTAVTLIDTNVAYHIINIVRALEIVGVSVCLIGIRPEAAQTMVSLGIDFSKVKTYHSLQQALKIKEIFGK